MHHARLLTTIQVEARPISAQQRMNTAYILLDEICTGDTRARAQLAVPQLSLQSTGIWRWWEIQL